MTRPSAGGGSASTRQPRKERLRPATSSMGMAIRTFSEFIKFPHTIFALPFALTAYVVATGGRIEPWRLFWVLTAMVSARTAAMTHNRIADRKFDSDNPRTKERALVAGRLRLRSAWGVLIFSSVLFLGSTWFLGMLPFVSAPFVLAILLGYSYTKRFTDFSHFVLGVCLGMAPIGAWAAAVGRIEVAPVLLGSAVLFWTAGFDLIYACQDIEVDRRQGLFSLAARLGVRRTLFLSSVLHLLCLPGFVLFGLLTDLGGVYYGGTAVAAVALMHQHRIVSADDFGRVNEAFFKANGVVSLALFAAAALDVCFL